MNEVRTSGRDVDPRMLARLRSACDAHPLGADRHQGSRATNADVAYAILEERLRRGIPGMGPRPGAPDEAPITELPDSTATAAVTAVAGRWPEVDAKTLDSMELAVLSGFERSHGLPSGYDAKGPDGRDSDVAIRVSPRFDGVWKPETGWHGRFENDASPSDALETLGRLVGDLLGGASSVPVSIIPSRYHGENLAWQRKRDDGSADWIRVDRHFPGKLLHASDQDLQDEAELLAATIRYYESDRALIEDRAATVEKAIVELLPSSVKLRKFSVEKHEDGVTSFAADVLLPRWDGGETPRTALVTHDGSAADLGGLSSVLDGAARAIRAAQGVAPFPKFDQVIAALLQEHTAGDIAKFLEWMPTGENEASPGSVLGKRTIAQSGKSALKDVAVVDGVVTGTARLTDAVRFDKGRLVLEDRKLPETLLLAIQGRRVGDLVDAPYVDPERIAKNVKATAKNLFATLAAAPVEIGGIAHEVARREALATERREAHLKAERAKLAQDDARRRHADDLARSARRDERHIGNCSKAPAGSDTYGFTGDDLADQWLAAFREAGGDTTTFVRRTIGKAWSMDDGERIEVDSARWVGTQPWQVSKGEEDTAWMLASVEDDRDLALVMLAAQLSQDMRIEHYRVGELEGKHTVCQGCARSMALGLVHIAREMELLPDWHRQSNRFVPMPSDRRRRMHPYDGVASIADLATRIGENHALVARDWRVVARVIDVRPQSERP